MQLEQQVVSLELSKKLRDLGVKQESFAWWIKAPKADGWFVGCNYSNSWKVISAFTVAELGEMLPIGTRFSKGEKGWTCNEPTSVDDKCWGFRAAKLEADARAKMLIYLLENKKGGEHYGKK